MMAANDTKKFITHYQKLQNIAQQLKDNSNPDIDKVLEQVKEAVESYQICKTRLDAATQELDKIMQSVESESSKKEDELAELDTNLEQDDL
jgi:exodeoxyribonuclease VII small subunit